MPTAAAATAAKAAAVAENDASAVAACAGSVFAAAHAVVDEGAEDEGACDDEVVGVAVHVLLRLVIVVFVRFEDVVPVAAPAEAGEANDGDAGYEQRGDDAVGIHHQPGGDVEDDVDDDHDAQHAAVARATCRGDFPPEPFFDLFRRDAQVAAPGEFLRALFGKHEVSQLRQPLTLGYSAHGLCHFVVVIGAYIVELSSCSANILHIYIRCDVDELVF